MARRSEVLPFLARLRDAARLPILYVTHALDEVDALAGTLEDKWSRVVNLRVCVVMRSQGADQAGAGNYIDCDGNSVASPDSHARRSFTAFYALRNRSGFLKP